MDKKELPEGWLLSTSGSAPRLIKAAELDVVGRSDFHPCNGGDYTLGSRTCQSTVLASNAINELSQRHNFKSVMRADAAGEFRSN
jgi:hypothetical protein